MSRAVRTRRVAGVWALLAALIALIAVIEGTTLFTPAPPERTGRIPVFGFREAQLGAVEAVWEGRTASVVRDAAGLWLRHAGGHRHDGGARDDTHHHGDSARDGEPHHHADANGDAHHHHADGTHGDGHQHADGARGDGHHHHAGASGDGHTHDAHAPGDTHRHETGAQGDGHHRDDGAHRADPAASAAIASSLDTAARMLADRRVPIERALEAYGLAKPPLMVAFYGRGEGGPDYTHPLDVLYVGDLLTTQYAYYALREDDREMSLIPRYQIALLLALLFGEENAPTPLPERGRAEPG